MEFLSQKISEDSTVIELAQWYFDTIAPKGLKEHTIFNNQSLISNYVLPYIGTKPVREISPVEIDELLSFLMERGALRPNKKLSDSTIRQKLMPIYESLFADGSYGYRPGRSAKDAIRKVKEYAEQGYTYAVELDLSKYFDTLDHVVLLNLLRRDIKDERVIQLIKRYLKSGVLEYGIVKETEEGSPQGENLSPLLANIYLNEFDQEFKKRGVPCIRYADDIVLLAKSRRASERLLETSTKYLEGTLKLIVNKEKSKAVSVFAIRNFKFLGFCLGKNGKGIYIRVHAKSMQKFKDNLQTLSSLKSVQSIKPALAQIKRCASGWLNYYGIADMKNPIEELNQWLCHWIRMCIWKQWKMPKTKYRNLVRLGIPEAYAFMAANSRKGYWRTTQTTTVNRAMSKQRLVNSGYYDLAVAYQSVHVNY